MDTLTLLSICLRRWYVFFPVLIIIGALGYQLAETRTPTYGASASMIVLPQEQRGPQEPPPLLNPYRASGGEGLLANALIRSLDAQQVRDRATEGAGDAQYAVFNSQQSPSVVEVQVLEAPSPEAALRVAELVVRFAQDRAEDLQVTAGAPPEQHLRVLPLVPPGDITVSQSDRNRLLAAMAAVALFTATGLALLTEVLARRLSRRRSRGSRALTSTAVTSQKQLPLWPDESKPAGSAVAIGPGGDGSPRAAGPVEPGDGVPPPQPADARDEDHAVTAPDR